MLKQTIVLIEGSHQAFLGASFMIIIYGLQNMEKNYWQMN